MNIYEKIINITVDLQNSKLKKSGNNKFAGFTYFELKDISPKINELCQQYKILINIKYTDQIATMDLIDAEKPEDKVSYTSPMSNINLKGAHDIQNLGAIQTYLRRYFFLTAFNIAENDELDCMKGNPQYEKDMTIREIQSLYQNFIDDRPNILTDISNKLDKQTIDQLKKQKNKLISKIKEKNQKIPV